MKIKMLNTVGSVLLFAIMTANAHARGASTGQMSIDNFKSNVRVAGAVTQGTYGDGNESDLLMGSASGNVTMKEFNSTVDVTGAVTQMTIGNNNTSSLLIGGASSH
jgi:hypothetical protein